MFYETLTDGNVNGSTVTVPPNQYNTSVYNGNVGTFLAAGGFLTPSNTFAFDPKAVTPYNMNLSIGAQRDIGFGSVLEVKYVGTLGRHLYTEANLNLLPLGAHFLPQNIDPTVANGTTPYPDNLLRPYPGYANVTYLSASSSSDYNSLQVVMNHRLSHGLTFGAVYTFAKVIDYNDTDLVIGTPTYLPASRNRSLAGFDQTHIFALHYSYNIPVPKGWQSNRAVNLIASNWQISGVTTFASGTPVPITFTTSPSVDLTGGGDPQRVNLTCDPSLPYSNRSLTEFFNLSCVQLPLKGQIGGAARNPVRGPGINNFDATIFRNFNVGSEKRVLTFRWEAYNVFNHAQFSTVDAAAIFTPAGVQTNGDFGYLNASRPPRVMQGSLRFRF
jgi:hypothetical protein